MLTFDSGLTYLLLRHPDVMAKLTHELRTAFQTEENITVETLARLPYLNACLEEGMRMYPPVPVGLPRVAPEGGAAICGKWVPEGTTVYVSQVAAYRSKDHWFEPESFIPERWLGQDDRFKDDNRSCFQPFSTGPRNCIGEITVILFPTVFPKLIFSFFFSKAGIWRTMKLGYCCARFSGITTSNSCLKAHSGWINGSISCGKSVL